MYKNKRILNAVTLVVLINSLIMPLNPVYAVQKQPVKGQVSANNQKTPNIQEQQYYQKVKSEIGQYYDQHPSKLSECAYQIYRTSERIIRANKLNEYSWRIEFSAKDYEVNASTTDANLITVEQGLVDTFNGDIDVLAFVLSHEFAHQLLRHEKEQSLIQQQHKQNLLTLDQQAKELNNSANNVNSYNTDILSTVINAVSVSSIKSKATQLQMQVNNEQTSYYARLQQLESDADRLAVVLMLRAGFDPFGSMRLFDYFDRFPSVADTKLCDHPDNSYRKASVSGYLSSIDIQQLKKEGADNISASHYLKLEPSLDGHSLIINSKYGSKDYGW